MRCTSLELASVKVMSQTLAPRNKQWWKWDRAEFEYWADLCLDNMDASGRTIPDFDNVMRTFIGKNLLEEQSTEVIHEIRLMMHTWWSHAFEISIRFEKEEIDYIYWV